MLSSGQFSKDRSMKWMSVVFTQQNDSHIVVHDPKHRSAGESFRLLRYRLEKMRERQLH